MVEVMKIMVTSFKSSMHTLLHSVPLTLQQAASDPCLHWRLWTLMGKSGSVSCGVTAPFSWVLVCTRFCLCPLFSWAPKSLQMVISLLSLFCFFNHSLQNQDYAAQL